MSTSKKSIPKYRVIADHLKAAIESGTYPPDSFLPSQNQMVADFNVALLTVRQALRVLDRDGFVRREHGRGVRVLSRTASPRSRFSQQEDCYTFIVSAEPELEWDTYESVMRGFAKDIRKRCGGEVVYKRIRPTSSSVDELLGFAGSYVGHVLTGQITEAMIQAVQSKNVPFVIAGDPNPGVSIEKVSCVRWQTDHTGQMAAMLLHTLGHKRVAICVDAISTDYQASLMRSLENQGSRLGLQCTMHVFDGSLINLARFAHANAHQDGDTAIIAIGEPVCGYLSELIESEGLSIPEDRSLLRMGGGPSSVKHSPSSLLFNFIQMGELCGEILHAAGKDTIHKDILPTYQAGNTLGPCSSVIHQMPAGHFSNDDLPS